MHKRLIASGSAPAAIGPYSQAVCVGNMIFTSGQLPIDPITGLLEKDDIRKAARQSLSNIRAILAEAGAAPEDIVKTTVYVRDLQDFASVNEVYTEFFREHYPARSCVQAARLPMDALIEIEAVACIGCIGTE